LSAHTYWRLLFEGQAPNNPGSYINISELQMRATSGGSNQCSGGTATADSNYGSQTPSLAFDGNNATYWESNQGTGNRWLKYQFASPVAVLEYVIRNGPFAVEGPSSWTLQYSDDNSTWHDADTRHQQAAWTANETRTFTLDADATNTLYWRLNITASDGGTYACIREMEMHATVGGADQCTGGTADSDTYSSGHLASAAFDNNTTTTYWESLGNSGPWWLRYRFSAPTSVAEYSIQGHNFGGEFPKTWTLERSGDGVNWTVVDTQTNITFTGGQTRTFTATQNYSDAVTEAATASESSAAGLNFDAVQVETATASASASALFVAAVSVSEAGSASEAASATLNAVVSATEAVTADETSGSVLTGVVSVTESASASDSDTAAISYPIEETASASATQSATLTIVADVTESASASDSSTGLRALPATASEAATATDSAAAGKRTLATRTEAASASTTQAATKRTNASRTETANATDKLAKPTVRASIAVSRVEAASAATSQGVSGNWARQVLEASSAADETSASYIGNVSSVNEATPATDVVTVLAELNESVTEAASAGDSIDAASEIIASVSEVATATEASGYAYDAVADVVEAITPTDASETTTDLLGDVNEMVAADDASAAYAGQVDIQVEAAAASDLAFAGITVNVSIEEPTDYLLSATDISDWLVVFGRLTGQTRLQPALTSTPAVRPALTHPVQIKPTVGAAIRIDSDE
jgi:hypothetical protein